jgi:hypothetical protein
MSRKRKADVEASELQFSQQASRIRNPHVHKAHFRTVGESGIDVHTVTRGRDSTATKIFDIPEDDATTVEPRPLEDDEAKKRTQVFANHRRYSIHK